MINVVSDYFKSQLQDIEQIHVGNSAGEKITFSVAGKRYFAKVLLSNAGLNKYHILTSVANVIPEAVIPFAFTCNAKGDIIAISTFIEGTTLDLLYPNLTLDERIAVGKKVGTFMRRLHSSTRCHVKEKLFYNTEDIHRVINEYVSPERKTVFLELIKRRWQTAEQSEKSLIHRDMQPQNIMVLSNGNIRVIDFDNAEIAPPLYDPSLCLMLSSKYNEFSFGVVHGYCESNIQENFWMKEKEHIAWQLLDYSLRYANSPTSIRRKFNQLVDYITSRQNEPPWWKTIMQEAYGKF